MSVAVEHQQQNVVVRLVNLPLVSSTYDMVSSAYVNTKDNHPYLKSVCDVAEKSVKTITSVAITSAMPIIQKLEPQIAIANNYACIGLDKIEEKLPILYQPSNKIVSNASDAVTGAKETVIQSITGVVDKTKEAVHESVEMTKAVVNGSINTVLGSGVVRMVSSGVDTALSKSETLLNEYLPPTDEELAIEATNTEGFEADTQKPNYYVRLGSLSSKARKRAYQQALVRVKDAKCRSQEAISQLNHTVDLIEYARKNVNNANQKIHDAQEKLYNSWADWRKSTGQSEGEAESAEHIESRTLSLARNLSQQLQTTCLSLVSSVQGLPQNVQDKAVRVSAMAGEIYQNFRTASSFGEVSDSFLTTSKGQIKKMKDSMDDVMDYLVNNTPLNWLVPDFSITDLSSETNDAPDFAAVEEEEMQDYSRLNGRIQCRQTE
ncbi:perilipin-2 isoform X1 [Bombina bombina]|uniref:perilipin-2 isoform X1 n=1 Tax=Bombina bombina TaxID=8345 RepID=UPI00235A47B2|nr:perilipin-2 isoform X1 [Bombina bombina]